MRINGTGFTERLATGVQRHYAPPEEKSTKEDPFEGLRVTLSDMGKARASASTKDIDDAELPDNVKEILKMIRELREKIAEKKAELQALAADTAMDPQLKQARLEALQGELASLQGALSIAQGNLLTALKDKRLSDGQRMQANSLAMA
ncbi:hypothetical protein [Pseudomonas subflava]|uniref:hypothetical protein n=1 Tax=Pseudomonas subflava TaxID=2952933 RepID=UPI002079E323|nr:hypothetical protein [Pseudomonas subflava]